MAEGHSAAFQFGCAASGAQQGSFMGAVLRPCQPEQAALASTKVLAAASALLRPLPSCPLLPNSPKEQEQTFTCNHASPCQAPALHPMAVLQSSRQPWWRMLTLSILILLHWWYRCSPSVAAGWAVAPMGMSRFCAALSARRWATMEACSRRKRSWVEAGPPRRGSPPSVRVALMRIRAARICRYHRWQVMHSRLLEVTPLPPPLDWWCCLPWAGGHLCSAGQARPAGSMGQ